MCPMGRKVIYLYGDIEMYEIKMFYSKHIV